MERHQTISRLAVQVMCAVAMKITVGKLVVEDTCCCGGVPGGKGGCWLGGTGVI